MTATQFRSVPCRLMSLTIPTDGENSEICTRTVVSEGVLL